MDKMVQQVARHFGCVTKNCQWDQVFGTYQVDLPKEKALEKLATVISSNETLKAIIHSQEGCIKFLWLDKTETS